MPLNSFMHPWAGYPAHKRPPTPANACELDAVDSARFLRVVSEGTLVKRHVDIFRWLNGELQWFLPHDILIAVWGDFDEWRLKFDITSALPGVRTANLEQCNVHDLVRVAHAGWLEAGRRPLLLLHTEEVIDRDVCSCHIHSALRGMRTIVVHGARDQRSGNDSLYIALSGGSPMRGRSKRQLLGAVDALVAQIDVAFRRVSALPLRSSVLAVPDREERSVLKLSDRERQILESICYGKTNNDIAAALAISPFTVKNHVQRIFRKIGVSNRTQAAARYFKEIRLSAVALATERHDPSVEQLLKRTV